MKPGKRNCERRRPFAWRGRYWISHLYLSRGEMCVCVCVLHVSSTRLSIRLCPVSATPPHPIALSVFSPCGMSLLSPIALISSALILSFSLPFSALTLRCTNTPLTLLSSLLSTHPWPPTSTMSVRWWCHSLPVAIPQITYCCTPSLLFFVIKQRLFK